MLRKIIILYLTSILLGFTACTQDAVPTPEPTDLQNLTPTQPRIIEPTPGIETTVNPTITTTPLGIEPKALEGISIQFWHPWIKDVAIESRIKKFNTENPYGIEVTTINLGGNLYQEVQSGINTGLLPDIVAAPVNQIVSWDNYRHIITLLDSYIQDPEWGLSEEDIADYYPVMWEQGVVNGMRLGIPGISASSLLLYNQSWAVELGFDSPPTTPSEFKSQACAAAADSIVNLNSTLISGGWIANTDPSTMMGWILAHGGNVINDTVDRYAINSPEAKSAFDFVKGLFKSGCAWIPETLYPDTEFASRGGLFYSTSINGIPFIKSAFNAAGNSDEWIVIPYPSSIVEPVISLHTSSYAILKSIPEKQLAAWILIKWLNQPENQAFLVETTGALPSRKSTNNLLEDYANDNHQWSIALDLVHYGVEDPNLGSWSIARWAISDAVTTLLDPKFTDEEIHTLLEDLNILMEEIHFQNR
jgi:ABC-type glycerol-3-phosphate transport system substrate-binding protein